MGELELISRVDALQLRYADALDSKDMDAWVNCFDEQGASYICIALENVRDELPLALMMDDSIARIRDRAKFVTKVWAGTFEDYTTRHFVQRLTVQPGTETLVTVRSNFMVTYTTAAGSSEILATGQYLDEIGLPDSGAFFRSRRAVLDTVATPRYLVYPI
ncbi:MAG TPA: aromatic-ring-hydroxylating dioxygenase subunit beta [Ramlibacter sp.]|uniref:aromatic-ring-hydroxylating dioxygenase subunit beta n=1 Tax=Ramlibacter sp. TaxID=1917967 RepID=UPI002D159BF4|nr:aromatic-ring-hydroxylating dioxygenase subunit beta [Ramlibacter sp.]HVZ46502.1 aromatic-ring-hydroxylating dioxygenase subunit beta [Ramlibacter sp.]